VPAMANVTARLRHGPVNVALRTRYLPGGTYTVAGAGRPAGVRPRAVEGARRVRRAVGAGAIAQHVVHCAACRVGQEQEGGVQVHERAQDGLGHGHVFVFPQADR
jgi:hypothetical protein